jgi:hypothetical protein
MRIATEMHGEKRLCQQPLAMRRRQAREAGSFVNPDEVKSNLPFYREKQRMMKNVSPYMKSAIEHCHKLSVPNFVVMLLLHLSDCFNTGICQLPR